MGLRLMRAALVVAAAAGTLAAAPKLRLTNAAFGPISIVQGQNGPLLTAGETGKLEAWNAGDGQLSLQVKSSAAWLAPAIKVPQPCATRSGTCTPLELSLNTASLAKGIYTGEVTVMAPGAIDAPQTITVTVAIGGGVPDSITVYAPPNGNGKAKFSTNQTVYPTPSTDNGKTWLSVAADAVGTFKYGLTYTVTAGPVSGMGEGDYKGAVRISNSTFTADNKSVPVNLKVTSLPILEVPERISVRIPQNTPKRVVNLVWTNRGVATAGVSAVQVQTASGGNWVTAGDKQDWGVPLTFDPATLNTGTYQGTVTISSNAVNAAGGNQVVPVQFEVVPQTTPVVSYRGAVNNATFRFDESAAPGDIMAVFGDQFAYDENPLWAANIPLEKTLGKTSVWVSKGDGTGTQQAPLFYSSPGQINFQLPFEIPAGQALVWVERDGQKSNLVSMTVKARAPHILVFGDYSISFIGNSLTFPTGMVPGSRPVKRGEVIVMYVTGLGMTSPSVATGSGAPGAEPLARVQAYTTVTFGERILGLPNATSATDYAGGAPTWVGLNQINVRVPNNAPIGSRVPIAVDVDGITSNVAYIAIAAE